MFECKSIWQCDCPGTKGEMPSMQVFLRDPNSHKFQKKTTENSEHLGRQAQLGIEPSTSYLQVFRIEPLSHRWDKLFLKTTISKT